MARKLTCIGIDNYISPEISNLKFACKDAKAIFDVLVNKNFGEFEKNNSILLLNPSKLEIEGVLEEAIVKLDSDDTFLVFFAGHGKLSHDYNLFLCPSDAQPNKLMSTCVSISLLNTLFEWSQCIRNIILLDCCYSGAIGHSFRFRGNDSPNKSLESMSGRGKIIISGSGAWEQTKEIDELSHGLFTYHLLDGIQTGLGDIDGDGLISCTDIFKYTYTKVTETSKQEPTLWGLDIKGDVYLAINPKAKFRKIISEIDKREMVLIDGGISPLGKKNSDTHLSDYYIDVYPVTNQDYLNFVKNTGYDCPSHWENGVFDDKIRDHPVVNVTYIDAENYARWAGKRLPSELEWEKAGRGTEGLVYPWGNTPTVAKTNVRESGINTTTPVDQYKSCISPYGVFDLSGNVWEWCSTETNTNRRVLKGSAFSSPFEYAELSNTNDANITMKDDDTGFRCVWESS